MTTDLRERLDDLLTEVPSYVVPDASTAWRAGARRRTRRRAVLAGSVVGALALIAGTVTWGARLTEAPPANGGGSGEKAAQSYPLRIEHPLLRTGTLPDDVGAIAGVVQRPDGWYAVGQRGQVWKLSGESETGWLPAVSPDGSQLAYVRGHGDRPDLVMLDLRAGTEKSTGLTPPFPTLRSPLLLHTQMFWSPDSSRLFVPVVPGPGQGEPTAMVVPRHGRTRGLVNPVQGKVLPAGWYDDHTLVWVSWTKDREGGEIVGSATAYLTDLSGHLVRRIPLHMKGVWTDPPDFTSVSVAPGGDVLALGTDQGPELSVWWFHLKGPLQGRLKAELDPSPYSNPSGCPASWSDTIQLPGAGYPDTILASPGGGSTIYADPRLDIGCSVWASGALSGTTYRDFTARVFDDPNRPHAGTTSWLAWHWRETLILSAVAAALLVGVVVWRRRRRESRLTTAETPG